MRFSSSLLPFVSLLSLSLPATALPPTQEPITSQSSSHAANLHDLLYLHKSLITHASVTQNEDNVTNWLANFLRALDFTVHLQPVESESNTTRHNLHAYPSSGTAKSRVLLSSHLDTVPPFYNYSLRTSSGDALDPSTEQISADTQIWGRGSVDAKASVAAQVTALLDLLVNKKVKPEDVSLLYVVGEETDGIGMRTYSAALNHPNGHNTPAHRYDTVIFGEPTELKLAEGHKGIAVCKIFVEGKAAHSGYPELGVSANEILVKLLGRLREKDWGSSERYGNTTWNIGRMEGGVANNVIPVAASAGIAVRIAAEGPEFIEKLINSTIAELVEEDGDLEGRISVEWKGVGYAPVPCDTDVDGFETIVANYGTDVPNLEGDHRRILYGPGSILRAHGAEEYLLVRDLEAAVEGYKTLVLDALER